MYDSLKNLFKSLINMKILLISLYFGFSLLSTNASAQSQATPQAWQDTKILNQKVKEFLKIQSAGSPGKVEISSTPVDPSLRLESCPAPLVFFPSNTRPWGKTTVGIRCGQPNPWQIYVEANVSITGHYVIAAVPLAQNQTLTANDLMLQTGDLTTLPAGFMTDISMATGKLAKVSLGSGTILKQEMLKMPIVVLQGQNVKISTVGQGFTISTEGQALTNAAEGDVVKVRVQNGSIVSGIAKNNGQIEVAVR